MNWDKIVLFFCGLIVTSHGIIGDGDNSIGGMLNSGAQSIGGALNSGAATLLGVDDNYNAMPITNALLAGGEMMNSAINGDSGPGGPGKSGNIMKGFGDTAVKGATNLFGGAQGIAGAAGQGFNALSKVGSSVLSGASRFLEGPGTIAQKAGRGLNMIKGVKDTVMSGAKTLMEFSGPDSGGSGGLDDMGLSMLAMNSLLEDSIVPGEDISYDKTNIVPSEVVGPDVSVIPVPDEPNPYELMDVLNTVDNVVDAKIDGLSAVITGSDIVERGLNDIPGTFGDVTAGIGGFAKDLFNGSPSPGSPEVVLVDGPSGGPDPRVGATIQKIKNEMNEVGVSTSEFKALEPVVDMVSRSNPGDFFERVRGGLGNAFGITDSGGGSVGSAIASGINSFIEVLSPGDNNALALIGDVIEGKSDVLNSAISSVVEKGLEVVDDGRNAIYDDYAPNVDDGVINWREEFVDRDIYDRIESYGVRDHDEGVREYWDDFRGNIKDGIKTKMDLGFLVGRLFTQSKRALISGESFTDRENGDVYDYYPTKYRAPPVVSDHIHDGDGFGGPQVTEDSQLARLTVGYYKTPREQQGVFRPNQRFNPGVRHQAQNPRRQTGGFRGSQSRGGSVGGRFRPTFQMSRRPTHPFPSSFGGRQRLSPLRSFASPYPIIRGPSGPPILPGPPGPQGRMPFISSPMLPPGPIPMGPGGGFRPPFGGPGGAFRPPFGGPGGAFRPPFGGPGPTIPGGPPMLPPPSPFVPVG